MDPNQPLPAKRSAPPVPGAGGVPPPARRHAPPEEKKEEVKVEEKKEVKVEEKKEEVKVEERKVEEKGKEEKKEGEGEKKEGDGEKKEGEGENSQVHEIMKLGNERLGKMQSELQAAINESKENGELDKVLNVVREYVGNEELESSAVAVLKRFEERLNSLMGDQELVEKMQKDKGIVFNELSKCETDFMGSFAGLMEKSDAALAAIQKDEDLAELVEESKKTMDEFMAMEETNEIIERTTRMLTEYAASDDAKHRSQQLGVAAQDAWSQHGDDIVTTVENLIDDGVTKYKETDVDAERQNLLELKDKGEKALTEGLEITEDDAKGKELVSKLQEKQEEGILSEQDKEEALKRKKEMVAMGITAMKEIRESEKGRELLVSGLEIVKEIEQDGGVEGLISKGEVYLTDAEKRQELIDGIKDKALDFLLEYLPTVQIAKITGTKEELSIDYWLDNIDLSGLLIPKTSVDVQLNLIPGQVVGTNFLLASKNIRVDLRQVQWEYERTWFPRINGGGEADCKSEDVEFRVSLVVEENEQKRPMLAMKDPTIIIHHLELEIRGSAISSVYNMLAGMFESAVKLQLEESLVEKLVETSAELLGPLNQLASDYWPLIQTLADALLKPEEGKIEEIVDVEGGSSSSSSTPALQPLPAKRAAPPVPTGAPALVPTPASDATPALTPTPAPGAAAAPSLLDSSPPPSEALSPSLL